MSFCAFLFKSAKYISFRRLYSDSLVFELSNCSRSLLYRVNLSSIILKSSITWHIRWIKLFDISSFSSSDFWLSSIPRKLKRYVFTEALTSWAEVVVCNIFIKSSIWPFAFSGVFIDIVIPPNKYSIYKYKTSFNFGIFYIKLYHNQ